MTEVEMTAEINKLAGEIQVGFDDLEHRIADLRRKHRSCHDSIDDTRAS